MQYAIDHYPAVRAAVEQVTATSAGVTVARAAYLPRLDALWQSNRATANNIFGQVLPQSVIPSLTGPVLASTSSQSVWGSATGALFTWEPVDFGLAQGSRRRRRSGGRAGARGRGADASRSRKRRRRCVSERRGRRARRRRSAGRRRSPRRAHAQRARARRQPAASRRRCVARGRRAGGRADAADSGAAGAGDRADDAGAGAGDRRSCPGRRDDICSNACRPAIAGLVDPVTTRIRSRRRVRRPSTPRWRSSRCCRARICRGCTCSRASSRAAAAPMRTARSTAAPTVSASNARTGPPAFRSSFRTSSISRACTPARPRPRRPPRARRRGTTKRC